MISLTSSSVIQGVTTKVAIVTQEDYKGQLTKMSLKRVGLVRVVFNQILEAMGSNKHVIFLVIKAMNN